MNSGTVAPAGKASFASRRPTATSGRKNQSSPPASSQQEWKVIAYATINQKEKFEPVANKLKTCPDQGQLENCLASCIQGIKQEGLIAELMICRDDLYLSVKAEIGVQGEQALFVRIPDTASLFEALTKRFKSASSLVEGVKVTVI
ncbi:MAG: hypothetical protein WCI52_00930 [bacterium]